MEERRSREKIIKLEIYTDGSLRKMGQTMTFGSWGFIAIRDDVKIYEAAGSEYNTTSQRMELEAIRQALQYASSIRRPYERVIIYSDSAYAINCYLQDWYVTWIKNGWVTSTGARVANQDLWEDIIPYFDDFWYVFAKVKGHANVFWNDACDKMVQAESEKLKQNWRGQNG